MASSIDEKVVQLTLDNKQFNQASGDTIDSLAKLKKALEFEGAIDSFDEIEKEIRRVDLSPIEQGVENVGRQFTILDTITDAVFRNLTNRAIDFGERTLKSLTVDQISQGWGKYAEQTGAVQTIMAATAQQFEDTGEQMEAVNEQLEKLTWFTDETSHRFNDMVSGIGKFTANNIDLETSVKAMEGIATWASLSGANASQASHAIYNLAQAVSTGSVKILDWRSIETASMSTTEFKQAAIETAEALGTLIKVGNETWSTLDGKGTVSVTNFTNELSRGWFTADVLLKTLEKYGGYADRLNEFVNETGVLTATAMNIVDNYVDGTLDMAEAMAATGLSAEDLTKWLEELGSEEYELGRRALRASQETKTFQEAIDYVKEAVSSGWATSFKYIFGDYLEAKEWWSEIAEVMYEAFVIGGEIRNTVLSMWKEKGGRDTFLDGIRALIENVMGLLDIFKEAWNEVWYGIDEDGQIRNQADALLALTQGFKDFADAIKPTEETAQNLRDILKAIFTILKTGVNIIKSVSRGLEPVFKLLNKISGSLMQILGDVARLINAGIERVFTPERLEKFSYWLDIIASLLSGVIQIGLLTIYDIGKKLIESFSGFFERVVTNGGGIKGIILTLIETASDFFNSLISGETIASKVVSGILAIFGSLATGIKIIVGTIIDLITGELTFDELFAKNGQLKDVASGFSAVIGSIDLKEAVSNFVNWVGDFVSALTGADGAIAHFISNVGSELEYFYGVFKNMLANIGINDIKDLLLIAVLWSFVSGLNKLNLSFTNAIKGITNSVTNINNILSKLAGTSRPTLDKLNTMFQRTTFLQIGIAVTLLVGALGKLNELDYEQTQRSVAALGVTMGMLLAVFKTAAKISASMPKKDKTLSVDVDNFATDILKVSASVLLVAQAIKTVNDAFIGEDGNIDIVRVVNGLAGVTVILAGMSYAVKTMNAVAKESKVANFTSILAIAVGLRLVITSVAFLANIKDSDKMLKGAASVGLILLAMGESVNLMSKINWSTALSLVPLILSFSSGLLLITGAIGILASLANSGNLAGALGVFTFEIIGLTGALTVLGLALKKVKPKTLNAIAKSFLAIGASILIISGALKIIEGYDWEGSKEAVIALGVGFAAIATAIGVLGKLLKDVKSSQLKTIGFAFIELSGSIVIFAAALKILEGVNFDKVSSSLGVIAAFMGVFTALGVILGAVSTQFPGFADIVANSMDKMASAFIKFGLAITAISAGIFLLSAATGLFAAIVGAIQATASALGLDLPEMISTGFDTTKLIISEFLEMLRELAPELLLTFVELFGVIAVAIEAVKHPTATAIVGIVLACAETFREHGHEILDALTDVINMIADADELFEALENLAGRLARFLGATFVTVLVEFVLGALGVAWDGVKEWFGGKVDDLGASTKGRLDNALETLFDPSKGVRYKANALKTAQEIVDGFDEGLNDLDEVSAARAKLLIQTFKTNVNNGTEELLEKDLPKQLEESAKVAAKSSNAAGNTVGDGFVDGFDEATDPDRPMDFVRDRVANDLPNQMNLGVEDARDSIENSGITIGDIFSGAIWDVVAENMAGLKDYVIDQLAGYAEDMGVTMPNLVKGKTKKSTTGSNKNDEFLAEMAERQSKRPQKKSAAEEAGEQSAEDWWKGLSSGMTSSAASSALGSAARSQAQTIADAFSDEIDKLSRDEKLQSKLYSLWQAQNPNATDAEKNAKDIENQLALIDIQSKRAAATQEIYRQTLEAMGEGAKETDEAYLDMLDDQIKLIEMQNKLAEAQKTATTSNVEAFRKYADVVKKWDVDYLIEAGFSYEEIARAAATEAGVQLPNAVKDTSSKIGTAMNDVASDVTNGAVSSMVENLTSSNTIETLKTAGSNLDQHVADGANENIGVLATAGNNMGTTVVENVESRDILNKTEAAGNNIDQTLGDSLEDNSDIPGDAATDMANLMLDNINAVWGINGETSSVANDIGGFIAEGMAQGIKEKESLITKAAEEAAAAAYAAAMRRLQAHSPSRLMRNVGMYYDQGFALGITDYTKVITKSATEMVDDLVDSTENSLDSRTKAQNYLQKIFGLDDEAVHVNVVMDLDSREYDDKMSELERAYLVARSDTPDTSTAYQTASTVGDGYLSKSMRQLANTEAYRNTQLNRIYNLVDEYFTAAKFGKVEAPTQTSGNDEPTNISFVQNLYSPKAISRLDTYRQTKRQFDTFASKYNKIKR